MKLTEQERTFWEDVFLKALPSVMTETLTRGDEEVASVDGRSDVAALIADTAILALRDRMT